MNDMQDTWTDTISEILSFLAYGWSYHEIVYKRRTGNSRDPRQNSKFTDGLIGWQKLPIRAQETLFRWEYDEADNLTGMTQLPPPDYRMATIPIEKALHFRTKSRKNNPEGRSILDLHTGLGTSSAGFRKSRASASRETLLASRC